MSKSMPSLPESFLRSIEAQFPSDFMTREPQELLTYGKDWTKVHTPAPRAVVFPRTTEEVSRFLKLCQEQEIAVVPSGGRTGLAAGAVAACGEVVLSLTRMNHMGPVDTLSSTVRVQAGAITQAVHQHCEPWGLTWPVDFASKGSSHVGGNIATNAGGVKVIRYGLTRNWVLGLQVVTLSGEVLELNGALEKNNTGVDLRQLFIGSEGILGVITEATLKLAPLPKASDVFFFGLKDIPAALHLFHEARKAPFQIMAFEFLTDRCMQAVAEHKGVRPPFSGDCGAYVLLEVEKASSENGKSPSEAWLESVFENQWVIDGTASQSERESKELWSFRESITESVGAQGVVHKNDIALPIAHLGAFIHEFEERFAAQHGSLRVFIFGHIGDGNLHISTLKPASMALQEFHERCQQADETLFSLVLKHQGSISAEHGVGLLKKSALHYSRTPLEIALMRQLKQVFDPKGLLNPGKIFDL